MSESRKAPCKDCEERHEACHDTCRNYQKWREKYRKPEKLEVEKEYNNYMADSMRRMSRGHTHNPTLRMHKK